MVYHRCNARGCQPAAEASGILLVTLHPASTCSSLTMHSMIRLGCLLHFRQNCLSMGILASSLQLGLWPNGFVSLASTYPEVAPALRKFWEAGHQNGLYLGK